MSQVWEWRTQVITPAHGKDAHLLWCLSKGEVLSNWRCLSSSRNDIDLIKRMNADACKNVWKHLILLPSSFKYHKAHLFIKMTLKTNLNDQWMLLKWMKFFMFTDVDWNKYEHRNLNFRLYLTSWKYTFPPWTQVSTTDKNKLAFLGAFPP